jgi:hypothetical protein
MKLEHSGMQSDSSRSVREADRYNKTATEGHRKKSKAERLAEWDEEETRKLYELKADIEKLELQMRQDRRMRRMRNLPMEKAKAKWPVRELMVMRQRRLLRKWLRYAENFKATEEKMIDHCWPETGKGLDDWDDEEDELGSADDLKDCQEGREEEIPDCQEGNELRSAEDLTDCHEDSQGVSICQLGNDQRSLRDLEDCQEGSRSILNCEVGRDENLGPSEGLTESSIQQGVLMKMGSVDLIVCQEGSGDIPYCQVGRDEQVNLDQPEELTEQMRLSEGLINSRTNLDQPMQLTEEEEHQDGILMIGGIGIFLPSAQEEAEFSVADAATTEEQSQLTMTVQDKLVQVVQTAQAEERKEKERSGERLDDFSQGVEREEAVALKLTAEEETEAEGEDEHSEEWLSIFSQEAEKNATWEATEAEEEEADNICFVELWEQVEALEERIKVQGMHIQQVKLEMDEEGVGDHDDLPNGQKFLQLRRLHEQGQPLEQLDVVISEIRELMLKSADTVSKERLNRKKEAATAVQQQQQDGADGQLHRFVWDPGGFQQLQRKLMSRSS